MERSIGLVKKQEWFSTTLTVNEKVSVTAKLEESELSGRNCLLERMLFGLRVGPGRRCSSFKRKKNAPKNNAGKD